MFVLTRSESLTTVGHGLLGSTLVCSFPTQTSGGGFAEGADHSGNLASLSSVCLTGFFAVLQFLTIAAMVLNSLSHQR